MATDVVLTTDEERDLARSAQAGDVAARDRLSLAMEPLVRRVARRYRARHAERDDLEQEGRMGVLWAIQDFDADLHGCRLEDYASIWVKAFIHRAVILNASLIRVPQHVFRRRKASRLQPNSIQSREGGAAGEVIVEPLGGRDVVDHRRRLLDDDEWLLLQVALRRLNPVEAWVLRERYGLASIDESAMPAPDQFGTSARPTYYQRTMGDLEADSGLSAPRIRHVESCALAKLRAGLGGLVAITA